MFYIRLEQLMGVELILKALRQTECIASHELADGIERTLVHVDEDEKATMANPNPSSTPPTLKVVQ